jgi:hypothetical protein
MGIGSFRGANAGGLRALLLADIDDLLNEFEPYLLPTNAQIIEDSLVLKDGKELQYIGFAYDHGAYDFEHKNGAWGISHNDKISVSIPQISPEVHEWVFQATRHRYVCIGIDNNNMAMLVGSSNFPCKIAMKAGTGDKFTSSNQYLFDITCEKPYQSRFYQMIQPPNIPTRKVYDAGFDWGYLKTWN